MAAFKIKDWPAGTYLDTKQLPPHALHRLEAMVLDALRDEIWPRTSASPKLPEETVIVRIDLKVEIDVAVSKEDHVRERGNWVTYRVDLPVERGTAEVAMKDLEGNMLKTTSELLKESFRPPEEKGT